MHRNSAQRRVLQHPKQYRALGASAAIAAGVASLLGPFAAVARADNVNWDAVADCESGGNWRANTGNGFYGGLQFKESTWKEFGGKGSPANASRAEQIAVANRVLAEQGPDAWPKCGPGTLHDPAIAGWLPRPLRGLVKTIWSSVPH
ncbi:MAG TPA: transglycosylase family protein [Mycobacterium sp.]|nr:transglycosylase family protein [Mycobacterium sp.]